MQAITTDKPHAGRVALVTEAARGQTIMANGGNSFGL